MHDLFALLVAIDRYDQPGINDLSGCLNDLEGMELSLESYCKRSSNLTLHKRVLRNKKATRRAVIDGFKLFDSANQDDVCLFYFSGHGAQIDAPKEFSHEADKMLESLVCHVEKGNDNLLIDKELSCLIARAQSGKEVHFVVITDCCHSGSNTKDSTFKVRSVSPNINSREVSAYWGRSDYVEIKNEVGELIRLSSPIGKHFKIGACTSSELAKEKVLGSDGKIRGVFTYGLLEVLKENSYNLSYSNLVRKIKIKTQALAKDQSPQIETIALPPQECSRIFLNGLFDDEKPTFQISYEKVQGRWVINVGHIYGVQEADIAVLDNGTEVVIKKVYINFSLLDFGPLSFFDREKIYDASIRPGSKKKLNLAFAPDSNEECKNVFSTLLKETRSPAIDFDSNKGIDYVIRTVDNVLALTHPEGKTPVFSRIPGQEKAQARLFLKIVEQIAEWHHIISISNPGSTIREAEIGIDLRMVENPQSQQNPDGAPATLIENWQGENVFRYIFDPTIPGGPWHPPAFRLSIGNHSHTRSFWVSALYCGSGYTFDRTHYTSTLFSITNRFLEKELLAAKGQIAKLMDEIHDHHANYHIAYESIQLSLLDDYFDQGYNEIKDLIKIFVSTEELDTSPFNMHGIPIDTEGILAARPAGKNPLLQPPQPDWRTFEIPITVVRPRDQGLLGVGQDKSFYGLTIVGHPTFSARIILSTVDEFIRSTTLTRTGDDGKSSQSNELNGRNICMARPEIIFGNETVRTIELTNGLGEIQGCGVIEFYGTAGAEFINHERPLRLNIDPNKIRIETTRKIILVGYSAVERMYFALGTMDKNQEIRVDLLPYESPSLIDGLGGSIKLLLLSVQSGFEITSYGGSRR
ncbi:MAG TPA: caspase family protein [Anaerolineales bacterium]|nr:caspase family protein [Anaerolineales bacterium]